MSTAMGSPACEGMYSKLIDDEASYFDEPLQSRNPDVGLGHTAVPVPSVRVAPGPSGPGPYRLATICLATLCAVLLISIIAVAAHNKNSSREVGANGADPAETEGLIQRQKQEANVTALSAALSKVQQEKADLQQEKADLQREKADLQREKADLQREKADLQRERDQLMARLAAKPTPKAPEATRPVTVQATVPYVCPANWVFFNKSCYFVSRNSMSWSYSQRYCQDRGGHLAIIQTAEEQTYLWESLPRGHWNAYWFGITDGHTEDVWKWVDDTPLVTSFWEDGEPNNHINEDCGYMVKTTVMERVAVKSWYDAPCSMDRPFICEKEVTNL